MMQDHSQAAMRNCRAYASPLIPKACNELPCLAGLLTRPNLSPSHTDGPYSGLIMTDLTQTYSSGHCCRFARHSLGQSGCKDTAFICMRICVAKKSSQNPFQNPTKHSHLILNDFKMIFLGFLCAAYQQKEVPRGTS